MNFESFRPKSKEELEEQLKASEAVLGEKIAPDAYSVDRDLDISNIQEKYKTRYEAYLETLRAQKQGDLETKEINAAKEWIHGLNNLDRYIKDHESKDNPLLREKQFLVFKKIRDFLEQGKREGYVKLPAGTGKTILFAKIAESLDMKTLIVAPKIQILHQNNQEVEKFTDAESGTYYGKNKDLDKKVVNTTYNSLVNMVKGGVINPDDIPVLILDEAHRALGEETSQVVNKFNGLRLEFTATPKFSENKMLASEEIFSMDIKDAIQEGMACQTKVIHAYTSVDISNVDIKNGKYDEAQIEKALNVHGRNMSVVELYKNKFSHLKAFCNCSGVKHAQDLADLFNQYGVKAACITADTPEGKDEGQRGWILQKYAEGEIKVLTNVGVLFEGFNEPTCSVTLNTNPTLSLVDAEQRVRSGRLDEANPDKWNYVVDFIDTKAERPAVLYSEILGDGVVTVLPKEKEERGPRGSYNPKAPIDLEDINVDGLRVVTDVESIMEVTQNNIEFREGFDNVMETKDGWKSASSLEKKGILKSSRGKIIETAEKYRVEHPEWFEMQKSRGGQVTEHYSPELIDILKKEQDVIQERKEGWENAESLNTKRIINADTKTIKGKVEKYRAEHTGWFEMQKIRNHKSEYYSPELIEILKKELNSISEKREGWESASSIQKKGIIKLNHVTIKKKAEKYRVEHPEWFEMQKSRVGQVTEHYSPELIEILKKE